jgi:hypothetical protein
MMLTASLAFVLTSAALYLARTVLLIRTLASAMTGLAVFVFTLSSGLDLAIAWSVISFVLNTFPISVRS